MSDTMKAARLYGPFDLRMTELPRPEPGPGQLLAKVERACVCSTDYAIYSGELYFVKTGDVTFPMTMGHEWSGTVAAVGPDVCGFKVGDRVVSDNGFGCGRCIHCLNGETFRCPDVRSLGTVHAWDGAFAEYILLPERHTFRLPDNVDFDSGALLEPMTVAFSGVRAAEVEPGDSVLVNGSGAIGLLAARLCRIAGAARVFLTGRNAFKLGKAAEFEAADVLIDTTRESIPETIARYTPGGRVDKVVETSGSLELLAAAFDVVRPGGVVAAIAFYDKCIPDFAIDRLVFNNITLRGVAAASGTHAACLALLESGRLRPGVLITGRYRFDELARALEDMKLRNQERIKWIIDFNR